MGATTVVALSLIIGLTVALWQAGVARQERDRADEQRARAERRFSDVRQLSNALLTDIAPKIERLEGSIEARQALVIQSLKYLDSLAQESGTDLQLHGELAAAYEQVGDLQGAPRKPNLSDFPGAISSYEKAKKIRRGMLERSPADFEYRKSLAANLTALATIRQWMSNVGPPLEDYAEAITIYDRLLAERPESVGLRLAASEARLGLANTHYFNDQIAAIYPLLRSALATLETLKQTDPEHVETRRLLGRGYTLLGMTLYWDGKQKEGEAEMMKAVAITESLVGQYPHDTFLKQGLLSTYLQAWQLYQDTDHARAFDILRVALRVALESVAGDRANTQARHNLAKTYSALGLVAILQKKPGEAIPYLEKSSAEYTELERIDPKNRNYKQDIGRVLLYLGQTQFQRRNWDDALATYTKAAALFEEDLRTDPNNNYPLRKLANVYTYIGDTHLDASRATTGQTRQTHVRAGKESHQRALDILMQLQSRNAFTEKDHKHVEEVRAALRYYEQQ
ncbi:MAG: tetratricopeptide repeat protein [Pyrinomonadaceae bacterium]